MKQTLAPAILVSITLLLSAAACSPAATPAATPVSSTATPILQTVTPFATVAPTQAIPAPAPTVQSRLQTDTVEFETTVSIDDTEALTGEVQKLNGVRNAQSSGQAMQVTYDPTKTNLQEIIAAIEDYGVRVKK